MTSPNHQGKIFVSTTIEVSEPPNPPLGTLISTSNGDPKQQAMTPYQNNSSYANRAPSPPRIYIPPPGVAYRTNQLGFFENQEVLRQEEMSSEAENQSFLSKVTHSNHVPNFHPREWVYDSRRHAQQILPFLFLGPYQASKNRDFLTNEGITLMLGVREKKTARFINPANLAVELGIPFVSFDLESHQELIAAFPKIIDTINNHLLEVYNRQETTNLGPKFGKVVVFCESGNERSAGAVTAYLMAMYEIDLATAVQAVQGQRFCISMDDSIKTWLLNYEFILDAQRQVVKATVADAMTGVSGVGGSQFLSDASNGRRKRSIRDTYDEESRDTEMGGMRGTAEVDAERFLEREKWVPFGDKVARG